MQSDSRMAGIFFPVSVVQLLHHQMGQRSLPYLPMEKGAAIYLTAVLEYLTAELVESVEPGAPLITCEVLHDAVAGDPEMQQLVLGTEFNDLITEGEDIAEDGQNEKQQFLHEHIRSLNVPALHIFLEKNDITPVQMKDALHVALASGGSPVNIIKMVEYLISIKSPMSVMDSFGSTPLHIACILGLSDCVKLLVSKGATLGDLKNHQIFSHFGLDTEAMRCLIELGAIPPTNQIFSCLEDIDPNACRNLSTGEIFDIASSFPGAIAKLLHVIPDFNMHGPNNKTLLHIAAEQEQSIMLEMVLRGASPAIADSAGMAPVHYMLLFPSDVSSGKLQSEFIAHSQAVINIPDNHGRTPLHIALQAAHIINASIDAFTSIFTALILTCKASLSAQDCNGRTSVHMFAAFPPERFSLIWNIVTASGSAIPINTPDKKGRTPLHYAAAHPHHANIKALLLAGADPNVKAINGGSPLHLLANSDRVLEFAIWKLLVTKGADINALDSYYCTPLDYVDAQLHSPLASENCPDDLSIANSSTPNSNLNDTTNETTPTTTISNANSNTTPITTSLPSLRRTLAMFLGARPSRDNLRNVDGERYGAAVQEANTSMESLDVEQGRALCGLEQGVGEEERGKEGKLDESDLLRHRLASVKMSDTPRKTNNGDEPANEFGSELLDVSFDISSSLCNERKEDDRASDGSPKRPRARFGDYSESERRIDDLEEENVALKVKVDALATNVSELKDVVLELKRTIERFTPQEPQNQPPLKRRRTSALLGWLF